jgi:hypothetical protein
MEEEEFRISLQQQVEMEASLEGEERSLPAAFSRIVLGQLVDLGEVEDPTIAHYEARGLRVSAYGVGGDDEILDLFVTQFDSDVGVSTMGKVEVEAHFKRLRTFATKCQNGLYESMEESTDAYDMAEHIQQVIRRVDRIRLFLLTDSKVRFEPIRVEEFEGVPVTCHVWDFDRLFKLSTSGKNREPITVDLVEMNGTPIACLGPEGTSGEIEAYFLVIPGAVLAEIYAQFGPRLLELNVRSFLQARGKVNRGIQETLKTEPDRFLAYNNGISMTASHVEIEPLADGGNGIATIKDLQIVNGGQTTASLYYAAVKGKVDLTRVRIQAKLSVIDGEILEQIVPRISEYANSQNKVNTADFSANDPFHVQLERLSRTVWAAPTEATPRLTRWFYERARGQYADELARERTPARQKQFKEVHPLNQKFTKTDLAKFENTWDQLPFSVALGAEKNFREFMLRLKERGQFQPDQLYFTRLVAKALLFRRTEKLIGSLQLGGYRSQTVTYTIALISNRTGQRIDLDAIWKLQELPPPLTDAIMTLAPVIHECLLDAPGRANVAEWCKKPQCWESVKSLDWKPRSDLETGLLAGGRGTATRNESSVVEVLSEEEQQDFLIVTSCSSDAWFELAAWAKQTSNLQAWQRSLAFSIGRLMENDKTPSRKQSVQGAKVLREAIRLGFGQSSA